MSNLLPCPFCGGAAHVASKSDREKLNRMLEEMFDESDMWLVSEFPTVRQVGI